MLALLDNLSIRLKITLIAVLGVLGFVTVLAQTISFFNDTSNKLDIIRANKLPVLQLTSELMRDLGHLNKLHQTAAAEGDETTFSEAQAFSQSTKNKILEISGISLEMKAQIKNMSSYFEKYSTGLERYTASIITGSLDEDLIFDSFVNIQQNKEQYEQSLQDVSAKLNNDLSITLENVQFQGSNAVKRELIIGGIFLVLMAFISLWFIRLITTSIVHAVQAANNIAEGQWNTNIPTSGDQVMSQLLTALTSMRDKLSQQHSDTQQRDKLQRRLASLNDAIRGEMTTSEIGDKVLQCMSSETKIVVGLFYTFDGEIISVVSTYAFDHRKGVKTHFTLGESLVGQCGLEKKQFVVEKLPDGFMPISSGTGTAKPGCVLLLPLLLNNELKGILELGSFTAFDQEDFSFLEQGQESIAIAIESAQSRTQVAGMLTQTQSQAEALQAQQAELKTSNRELEQQALELLHSEESLQEQQEELHVLNEELEQRAQVLDQQKTEILKKNKELKQTADEVQEKSKQLEQSSTYKSQFLSTMSHELRTPLNSILILSQNLMNNKENNLNSKQVGHAKVINSSGSDLLFLINDILDLSKVEEGKLELVIEQITTQEFANELQLQFEHQTSEKDIDFSVTLSADVPPIFFVDKYRLGQILKNFLSNAIKFTQQGKISVEISKSYGQFVPLRDNLKTNQSIIFKVTDSGIGIPKDKQSMVFEAFQQVDGTTSRKFGGTGLGLTISKQLASLMNGEIQIYSQGENTGCTFTVFLPIGSVHDLARESTEEEHQSTNVNNLYSKTKSTQSRNKNIQSTQYNSKVYSQDRQALQTSSSKPEHEMTLKDRHILMVDDDIKNLYSLTAALEEFHLKMSIASTAQAAIDKLVQDETIELVLMDIMMPEMDGYEAIRKLRSQEAFKALPIIALTARAKKTDREDCISAGANDYLSKPIKIDTLKKMLTKYLPPIQPEHESI
ncbi:MAG: response regulator [Pseudomonadales bacterium]|nr:response regulator [Pseudomonadales bacterium]